MRQHEYYKCPPECEGCQYCNGGLAFCTVCKQAEAELTKECPGPKEGMSKDTLIDEAKAFLKDRELYPGDAKHYADFADKIAADAVRERDEMLGNSMEICFTVGGYMRKTYEFCGKWFVLGDLDETEYDSPLEAWKALEAYRALKAAKEGE